MAGVKFSYKFPKLKVINNREQFLKEYVAGKSVLHAGCVDSDLLEERKESQLFLHDILGQSAGKLVGVDVDRQGIEKMLQLGYRDVFYADLESWDYPGKFDVIVLGEIIEHIDNCGDFLHSVRKFCGPDTEVIFTSPNNYYFLFWLYTWPGRKVFIRITITCSPFIRSNPCWGSLAFASGKISCYGIRSISPGWMIPAQSGSRSGSRLSS